MGFGLIFIGPPMSRKNMGGLINKYFWGMEFGSIKNVVKAVSFSGRVTVCSDLNVKPQIFRPGCI
jgi:hypothetical protein